MKKVIKDEANNKVYNLKNVELVQGFDRGLYGDWYFEVRLNYMDDDNTSGTWIVVSKFLFNSENPHLPKNAVTSEVTKEEARDLACAVLGILSGRLGIEIKGL